LGEEGLEVGDGFVAVELDPVGPGGGGGGEDLLDGGVAEHEDGLERGWQEADDFAGDLKLHLPDAGCQNETGEVGAGAGGGEGVVDVREAADFHAHGPVLNVPAPALPYHPSDMYLVVIGILSIILTLSGPLYPWVTQTGQVLGAVAGATLLPPALALLVARRTVRLLDRYPDEPSRGQAAFNGGLGRLNLVLAVCHGGLLLATTWLTICNGLPVVAKWPAVPGCIALLPFLLSVLLIWIVIYPADRGVRQYVVEIYLFRGKPVRPVWPLGEYLLYNLRHQVLFILVPMLVIMVASDIVMRYEGVLRRWTQQPYAADLVIGCVAVVVAVVAPEMLRHIWVTQRLPDGPLRDRLELLCRRLKLRCRDILVWRSGGMIVNAAVMGVVAPLRYVLITDAMLEQMDDTKIEAVFGHEAGHVKHHHIPCFLLFALISGCAVTVFSIQTRTLAAQQPQLYPVLLTALGVVILAKWAVVFGWVSRHFERQADVHGVRTLTLSGLPCALPCAVHTGNGVPVGQHVAPGAAADPPVPPSSRMAARDPLCATAAHVFSDALHDVAVLNGIQAEARSWRHSSIASRSRFVQELAGAPDRLVRFQRRVSRIQIGVLVVATVMTVWAAHALQLWKLVADAWHLLVKP
jgi:STE24 endopeptidase